MVTSPKHANKVQNSSIQAEALSTFFYAVSIVPSHEQLFKRHKQLNMKKNNEKGL